MYHTAEQPIEHQDDTTIERYGESQGFARLVCFSETPAQAGVIGLGEVWD